VGTLASAVGGAAAVEVLTPTLAALPIAGGERWAAPAALAVVIVVITFVSLVIGELAPKALALRNPERIACVVAPVLHVIARLAAAPNRVLTLSTRAVLTVLGQRAAAGPPPVSEEEVKILVQEGAARGIFEHHEAELVRRIFAFTDTPVRSIMTPRPNIRGLDVTMPPAEILRTAAEHERSRLPVFRGSIDEPVGFVTVKDLFAAVARGETPALDHLIRPALFVPEMMPVGALLREFQRRHASLALVVDEYGQVVGLITIEDVVEEIVGEVREEDEGPSLPFATRLPDGSYIIDGTASVRDLREHAGIAIPESLRYQTLAGFILDELGAVPAPGTTLRAAGYLWTVLEVDGPRILKLKAQTQPT
jgi:putative hemolysin